MPQSTKTPTGHLVIYHSDPDGLWAESPSVPGWSAAADSVNELRRLAEEGIRFALGDENAVVQHLDQGSSALEIARRIAPEGTGPYLALIDPEAKGGVRVVHLRREWTRIGRSRAADVRLDDPSVSRRHALFVRQPDGIRILDDRSLTGVFVNGEQVEWSALGHGDEIIIGRHRMYFVDR